MHYDICNVRCQLKRHHCVHTIPDIQYLVIMFLVLDEEVCMSHTHTSFEIDADQQEQQPNQMKCTQQYYEHI